MEAKIYFNPEPAAILVMAAILANNQEILDYVPIARLSKIFSDPFKNSTYILNLAPKNSDEVAKVAYLFLEENRHEKIRFWLDKHQPSWEGGALQKINRCAGHELVRLYNGTTALDLLAKMGYEIPEFWHRLAKELASGNMDKMTIAARNYYRAFQACRVYDQWKNKEQKLPAFFKHAARRLCLGLGDLNDDFLEKKAHPGDSFLWDHAHTIYDRMLRETEKAKNKLLDDEIPKQSRFNILPLATQAKIGYLNLEEVPNYLDMAEVMRAGREKFPYLFIVQYRYADHDYTAAFSREFDAKELLEAKDDIREIDPNDALKLLRKKLWDLKI